MRALGDPDVLLPTDLGVRRGAAALGLPDDPTRAGRARARELGALALVRDDPPLEARMTSIQSTMDTPAGPFTMIVDDDGAVLASGWTADVGRAAAAGPPAVCARRPPTARPRPRRGDPGRARLPRR